MEKIGKNSRRASPVFSFSGQLLIYAANVFTSIKDTMYETPGALRIKPKQLPKDVLDVFRLMPSHDNEQLLAHIAWLEEELANVRALQDVTQQELIGASNDLLLHEQHVELMETVAA